MHAFKKQIKLYRFKNVQILYSNNCQPHIQLYTRSTNVQEYIVYLQYLHFWCHKIFVSNFTVGESREEP